MKILFGQVYKHQTGEGLLQTKQILYRQGIPFLVLSPKARHSIPIAITVTNEKVPHLKLLHALLSGARTLGDHVKNDAIFQIFNRLSTDQLAVLAAAISAVQRGTAEKIKESINTLDSQWLN